ncbi:Cilia- and flagella-associated protein 44 [Eumeta japonica]|uniref:Cilia-and flagella-associated protein 44 n=1 Tax=Eumeta variegata TaxID=151549 RepID=A0A4C1XKY6_EUMVA|nr:Cilia- and flagella-associated protein 44 [Eumeta japonica]
MTIISSQIEAIDRQVTNFENRISEHEEEKIRLDDECLDLQQQFKHLVRDNKFADFLRRIFKKKYRPPRIREEDESSESESSSSSSADEDVETASDSGDIGPVRLDPDVCPEGCDRDLYDRTFVLRNARQKREQEIMEQNTLIENLLRDIEHHIRLKQKMTGKLEKKRNELREFMLEKQSCMNEVEQVVVLQYSQIRARAVVGCTGPQGLSQTVVFPEAILSRLRKRVLEIMDEIKEQKMRYRINRTHLHRMNIDLRAMDAEAGRVRAEMREVLTHKLGKPRRVDKTLDELLRLMARQFKLASFDTVPQLTAQLREWKVVVANNSTSQLLHQHSTNACGDCRKKHSEAEKKYLSTLQSHSERVRLAAAIQGNVIPRKHFKEPDNLVGGYSLDQYNRDVVRLRIIRAKQREDIRVRTYAFHIELLEIDVITKRFNHRRRGSPTKVLHEEIGKMKLKQPLGQPSSSPVSAPSGTERSRVEMYQTTRKTDREKEKYFPTTPLSSALQIVQGVNVMALLTDALDSMRTSRDEAPKLLQEMSAFLPDLVSGLIQN